MTNNTDTLATFAATTRAARFWTGIDASGHVAQFWTKEPDPADHPALAITAHVIMPLGAAGDPAGWEPVGAAPAAPAVLPADGEIANALAVIEYLKGRPQQDTPAFYGALKVVMRAAEAQFAGVSPVPESQPTALTDEQIVAVWQGMPGGPDGWLKSFGFIQFARAVLDAATPRCPHCDGTGDVHTPTGEWLGECSCEARAALSAPAAAPVAADAGLRVTLHGKGPHMPLDVWGEECLAGEFGAFRFAVHHRLWHDTLGVENFTVTSLDAGYSVGHGDSIEEAIANARANLKTITLEEFGVRVERAKEEEGLPPVSTDNQQEGQ